MNRDEVLQRIEDVLLNARYYLIQAYTDAMSYEEAVTRIKEELEKFDGTRIDVEAEDNEPTRYAITGQNWGSPAYLHEENGIYVVKVDGEDVTGRLPSAIQVLDEYVEYCQPDDFISDFVVGEEKGDCVYGDNKYAHYVQKCFEKYIIGQGI